MLSKLITLTKGGIGLGFIQLSDIIPTSDTIETIGKLILQIVVTVVTIISLLKKKKK